MVKEVLPLGLVHEAPVPGHVDRFRKGGRGVVHANARVHVPLRETFLQVQTRVGPRGPRSRHDDGGIAAVGIHKPRRARVHEGMRASVVRVDHRVATRSLDLVREKGGSDRVGAGPMGAGPFAGKPYRQAAIATDRHVAQHRGGVRVVDDGRGGEQDDLAVPCPRQQAVEQRRVAVQPRPLRGAVLGFGGLDRVDDPCRNVVGLVHDDDAVVERVGALPAQRFLHQLLGRRLAGPIDAQQRLHHRGPAVVVHERVVFLETQDLFGRVVERLDTRVDAQHVTAERRGLQRLVRLVGERSGADGLERVPEDVAARQRRLGHDERVASVVTRRHVDAHPRLARADSVIHDQSAIRRLRPKTRRHRHLVLELIRNVGRHRRLLVYLGQTPNVGSLVRRRPQRKHAIQRLVGGHGRGLMFVPSDPGFLLQASV